MTTEHEASRTLVKSPPELWAECSDAGSLARHLGEFGEIRITRLEPETTVAWEGEHASGTVRIEPSAWGTRVTLTAQTGDDEAAAVAEEAAAAVEEAAVAVEEAAAREDPPGPVEEPSATDVIMQPEVQVPDQVELPDDNPHTATEDGDATVEETVEDQDPVMASDTRALRIRWRRVRGRMRGLFAPRKIDESPEAPVVEGPGGSIASPPLAEDSPAEAEPAVEEPAVEEPAVEPKAELPLVEAEPTLESPAEAEPAPVEPAVEEPSEAEAVSSEPDLDAEAVLSAALDSLGQAHHRPFSRA